LRDFLRESCNEAIIRAMTEKPESTESGKSDDDTTAAEFLDGQVLIAMPGMQDPRFHRSLVYLCAHSGDGAMGIIVNKCADNLKLEDLFEKLGIPVGDLIAGTPVHYGGPVETGRGFVLHSADYKSDDATMKVDEATSMTATLDILHAMAGNRGPDRAIVALGYAGWSPGQLEAELQANGWLACPADQDLLFGPDEETKWDKALAKLGVHPSMLSATGGRA
jgi:putative transcriptional regulator